MKTMTKKAYLIPETETLSLESVGSLMGANDVSAGAVNDPSNPSPGKFGAPQKVY